MKNDPLERHLRELSWRRLTHGEQARLRAWLAAHPEAHTDWESEAALTEALAQLPDVPIASNFTARVLQTAEREAREGQRHVQAPLGIWRWPGRWWPRAALAGLVLGAGLLAINQARLVRLREERAQVAQREALAQSLENLAGASAVVGDLRPEPDRVVFLDFDAIQALNRTPLADDQLLEALK